MFLVVDTFLHYLMPLSFNNKRNQFGRSAVTTTFAIIMGMIVHLSLKERLKNEWYDFFY